MRDSAETCGRIVPQLILHGTDPRDRHPNEPLRIRRRSQFGRQREGRSRGRIPVANGRRVDGAILLYSRQDDQVVDFLKSNNYPFVLVGRSEKYPDLLSVDTDNVQAAYDATKHLISLDINGSALSAARLT